MNEKKMTVNPMWVLFLGACPALGTTGTLRGAVSMGITVLAVMLLTALVMALLRRILTAKQVWVAGVAGGLLHNLGQMAVALAVTRTPGLLIWLPVLLLCGLVTGLFTGLCAQLLLRRRLISDKGDTHDESQKK